MCTICTPVPTTVPVSTGWVDVCVGVTPAGGPVVMVGGSVLVGIPSVFVGAGGVAGVIVVVVPGIIDGVAAGVTLGTVEVGGGLAVTVDWSSVGSAATAVILHIPKLS